MNETTDEIMGDGPRKPDRALRRGWTTGACATAATKAALQALFTGEFPDPVSIDLPKGETPSFALAHERLDADFAEAGIVKDAGDDPDVTHGALILSKVRRLKAQRGVVFKGGIGVGTVTRAGLPLEVGEPAINPVPRQMMQSVVEDLCKKYQKPTDIEIEISVPEGEMLAKKTWNPRLGILGGISILGTTGVVNPFSCAAWIHSIHRGIDVARAEAFPHVAGSTGSTSEKAVQSYYNLPDAALLDMGDFVGGMLKYLRKNPVPRLTIAGGFAKLTKLAQGFLDLHSGRSQVDFRWLAERLQQAGYKDLESAVLAANTAQHVRELALAVGYDLAPVIAQEALITAVKHLQGTKMVVDVLVVDRQGKIIAHAGQDG